VHTAAKPKREEKSLNYKVADQHREAQSLKLELPKQANVLLSSLQR